MLLQISTSRKGKAKIPLGQLKSSFLPEGHEDFPGEEEQFLAQPEAPPDPTHRPPIDFRLKKIFVRGFPPDVRSCVPRFYFLYLLFSPFCSTG